MVLVLVIGDTHVPARAADLPPKFKELLVPGKIQHVLCTGNLCSKDVVDYLRGICAGSDVHMTCGEFDDAALGLPDTKVVTIGDFRIGLTHGHAIVPWGDLEALGAAQRLLDVDILVTGHTHAFQAFKYQDRFIINPGSATGAFSPITSDVRPSFVLSGADSA